MTVYVDDMFARKMGQLGRMKMSHMMADTEDELHAMADRLGLQRAWFQQVPSGDHYDVTISARKRAVTYGAVEVTMRELTAYAWHRRERGIILPPWSALDVMRSTMLKGERT